MGGRALDFIFVYYCLSMLALLAFSAYRLWHARGAGGLALLAAQIAALVFTLLLAGGGSQRDPFAFFLAFAAGVAAPAAAAALDIRNLAKKVKSRMSLSVGAFLYRDDRAESVRIVRKEKYVDAVLRPRAGNFPVSSIIDEISVERADTARNIQKQLEAADKQFAESDLDAAFATYQAIERIFRRSPSLYHNMGNICYIKGDFEGAAQLYARGIERAGANRPQADGVGDAADKEARDKLSQICFNLGNALFLCGKYGKALDAYKKSIEANPGNDDAYFNLSFCHAVDFAETGDTPSAAEAFARIIEDVPDNLHAWSHYGKCLMKMGEAARAAECFRKVVSDDAASPEGWYWLGLASDALGLPGEAIQAYKTAIEHKHDLIGAYNNLGILLSTVGRQGEALATLREALRLKPADAEILFNIGLVLHQSGKHDEALGELLSADRLNPDDESVLYMIAVVLAALDNRAESAAYLARAVQRDKRARARAKKEPAFAKYAEHPDFAGILS